jgi:quinoprotein glucose dehydrogenase
MKPGRHFAQAVARPILSLLLVWSLTSQAQHQLSQSKASKAYVAPASDEGQLAIKRIKPAPGLKVDLWAAEPMLANPVAFCFDEKGRAYVC